MPFWQRVLVAVAVPMTIILLGIVHELTQDAYEWLWMNTVGEPYTHILRRDPCHLFLPTFVLLSVLAGCLPRRCWARVFLVWATSALGLMAGHVVWGEGVIHLPG
jgi:hypothetical protein